MCSVFCPVTLAVSLWSSRVVQQTLTNKV
jgi:hypothetical protein